MTFTQQWSILAMLLCNLAMTLICVLAIVTNCGCRPDERTFAVDAYVWPEVPLIVTTQDDFVDALPYAVDLWNDAADCDLFVFDKGGDYGDVRVMSGEPADMECSDRGGCAYISLGMGWQVGYVWVTAPGLIDVEYRIIAHELGHILGLAHDLYSKHSIMKPTQAHPFYEDLPVTFVTHADAEALEDRYCMREAM